MADNVRGNTIFLIFAKKFEMKKFAIWIEAMRLRTLPASVSGVIAGIGFAFMAGVFKWMPAALCLVFAALAQIASNFANEYYDFKGGLDRPGREGPRRGVTEGDITPRAMRNATFATLAAACAVGLALVAWGGWWLIAVGLFIALGVLAYSTGPYPLSHHGLGEVAVLFFFGIIPVNFTFYLQTGLWDLTVLIGSISVGLMESNILIVNNYRDLEDDRAVGKRTSAVIFGRGTMSNVYLFNGFIAVALMWIAWMMATSIWWLAVPIAYLFGHTMLWLRMSSRWGAALNPLLGMTAVLMLLYCAGFAAAMFRG